MSSLIFLPSEAALERSVKDREAPKWLQGCKGRLQHDDIFADFDVSIEPAVMTTDISDYAHLFDQHDNSTFDLCPDGQENSAPPSISQNKHPPAISANARMSMALMPTDSPHNTIQKGPELPRLVPGDVFPSGIVLLKNWLSFEEQLRIIETIRNIGIGEGGFYTPIHEGKALLKFKFMCLGWSWNPVNRTYEKIRSNYDGAPVPPLPDFIKDLTHRCQRDANRLHGHPFTEMEPNACVCNFYSHDSYLGLHQDKNEGHESLRRQLPVISFSIGASGEFIFSQSRSMETAQSVLLESGDAFVFGGPSRMIFHGIRRIYPESMPAELTNMTGMRNGRLNLTIRQYIPDMS